MQEVLNSNRNDGSFLVQRVNFQQNEIEEKETQTIDKIKVLELNNCIDKWEAEVLFSENGFYSLKGKDVLGKSDEFLRELEQFINSQTDKMKLVDVVAKETIIKLKKSKMSAIALKMKIYEQNELNNWELNVYNEALYSCIKRAVLYKNDVDVISNSFNNGLNVLNLISEKENWNKKTISKKTEIYRSEFYYSLITAFMNDRDINAYRYFNKFKEYLKIQDKEALEKSLEELKNNIIAYNWAKEVYSYKLSDFELNKHINSIEDNEVRSIAKQYLKDFKISEEKQKEEKEKKSTNKNWEDVISAYEENPDTALLYIDYTLPQEHIKAVKKYISAMKKDGFITTDKEQFISLIKEVFEDFNNYKNKDISKYRAILSNEDFKIFENFQNLENSEYEKLFFDYEYSLKKLEAIGIKTTNDKYDYAKLLLCYLNQESDKNKRNDLNSRNKLIDAVVERFEQNKEK